MLSLASAPHGDRGSNAFLGFDPTGALSRRIHIALEHDEGGSAGRICCGEQRRRRERADCDEKCRFGTSEIVEHCGDAVGPLLDGRQRARSDRIGGSGAGWSKKISRPSEVIASTQPCREGNSGSSSQQVNQGGTNTMSRSPSADAR